MFRYNNGGRARRRKVLVVSCVVVVVAHRDNRQRLINSKFRRSNAVTISGTCTCVIRKVSIGNSKSVISVGAIGDSCCPFGVI